MKELKTLADLIDISAQKYANRPLFGYKSGDRYAWITYAEFHKKMERLRSGLSAMGLKSGDVAAIISGNNVPFAMTVYAAYGLGAAVVPMYEVQKAEDWAYIIRDCGARFVFVNNARIARTVEEFAIETVERIIFLTDSPDAQEFDSVEKIIARSPEGMKSRDAGEDSLADILYTSGTTGRPKGVLLTHRNIVANAVHTFDGFDASCQDRSLSFLPWAHAFGKTVELHIFPYFGASVALAESARTIAKNLREAQPTILVGVPKVFNKFYDSIHLEAEKNPLSRALFEAADDLSLKARKKPLSGLESLGLKALRAAMGPKIRSAFGGKLRFCISGGAPLAIEIVQFFAGFGITIFEGYGMTETAPIVAVNKHGHVKFGSVGRVLNCNRVEIVPIESDSDLPPKPNGESGTAAPIGEVVVSGACVMKAYNNLPELTAEAMTGGAFKTGDLGYIDGDGYLFLTGRVKEQYKLENGKYVVPGALEEKIKTSPIIEHVVMFGAGKPYNVAIVRPSDEYFSKFAARRKLSGQTPEQLARNPELEAEIFAEVQKMSEDFRGYERPQKIAVVADAFTIENGMLTPALKLRRHAVEKRCKDRIEALYGAQM